MIKSTSPLGFFYFDIFRRPAIMILKKFNCQYISSSSISKNKSSTLFYSICDQIFHIYTKLNTSSI